MADRFARGRQAHAARFAKWTCDKCGDSCEEDWYVHHLYCNGCHRWMKWEPIEEVKC
jgi:hypothetical protein